MINEFRYGQTWKKFGHLHLVYHFTVPLRHGNNLNWKINWLGCNWFKSTIENVEKLVSENLTKPRQI